MRHTSRAALLAAVAATVMTTVLSTSVPAGATAVGVGSTTTLRYGRVDLQRDVDAIRKIGTIGVEARVITSNGANLVATSGTAVLGTKRPVPANGYVRIASATKTFVAVVVLQLAAEGKLSLDDTVEELLPGVVHGNGNDGSKITVRQVLQHTSGIHDAFPSYSSAEEILKHRFDRYTDEEIVAKAMKHKPDFEPGTSWGYSNSNYMVAGMIIKKVTGNPWHKEVAARISRPLGLSRTVWSGTSNDVPRPHARGYMVLPPAAPVDMTAHFDGDAAGGLISTTGDTNRFLRALLDGRLVPSAQLAEMKKTVRTPDFGAGTGYGLGIMSTPLSCGGVYWNHGGDDYGYKTRTGVTADGRRSVVVALTTQFFDEKRGPEQEKAAGDLIDRALCARR